MEAFLKHKHHTTSAGAPSTTQVSPSENAPTVGQDDTAETAGASGVHQFKVTAIHTHGMCLHCSCGTFTHALQSIFLSSLSHSRVTWRRTLRYSTAAFSDVRRSNRTVAIGLDTLELYHQLRRRRASLSIQSMVKVLCALNNVSSVLLAGLVDHRLTLYDR